MPSCHCGKNLASPAGLRRHINSQHSQSEHHTCECGKRFLDPAGRSRCRARHQRSFGCSGCPYRSGRKDSVKLHIRRVHRGYHDLEILTLPVGMDPLGFLPGVGAAVDFVPAGLNPPPFYPPIFQPQYDARSVPDFSSPSPSYHSEGSPGGWNLY